MPGKEKLLTYPSGSEGAFMSGELVPPYCVLVFLAVNIDIVIAG